MKSKIISIVIFFLFASSVTFAQKVYITQTGQHYHTAKCKMVNKNSSSLNLTQAIATGRTPCDKCHPPTTAVANKKKTAKKKK